MVGGLAVILCQGNKINSSSFSQGLVQMLRLWYLDLLLLQQKFGYLCAWRGDLSQCAPL